MTSYEEERRLFWTAMEKREKAGRWTREMVDGLPWAVLNDVYREEFKEDSPLGFVSYGATEEEVRECLASGKKYEMPQQYHDLIKAGAMF